METNICLILDIKIHAYYLVAVTLIREKETSRPHYLSKSSDAITLKVCVNADFENQEHFHKWFPFSNENAR